MLTDIQFNQLLQYARQIHGAGVVQMDAGDFRSLIAELQHWRAGSGLPIQALNRKDLYQAGLTDEEIARLSDQDLAHILHAVRDHFANDVFWEEVEYSARQILEKK
jgi:hypothetical protein